MKVILTGGALIMKKIMAFLIIAAVLLGACSEAAPEAIFEPDGEPTVAIPPAAEEDEPEPEPEPEPDESEPETDEEPPIIIENDPVPPLTDEEILILKDFVQRVCFVLGMMPYFDDINDVGLSIILQQYFEAYGWDFSDTDVFSDGENQHHYSAEETENYFGSVLGVSPARLDEFMKEYFNPHFSIENYDYKAMSWDDERELIVSWIYGGGIHWWVSTHITEIVEEDGTYHVYALKTGWGDGMYIQDIKFIRCTFTRNANGNFNIMSKQLVPESEYPEQVSEFIAFIDRITNDVDVAYEYAVEFDVFDEINEMRGCLSCHESPRNLCDYCINNMAIRIIFREAVQVFNP
jgi:hypothetical protein